jgi:hypothetical protein
MLAGLFSRGFGVVHDKRRLALSWNDRPLTLVSVWSVVSENALCFNFFFFSLSFLFISIRHFVAIFFQRATSTEHDPLTL